MSRSYKHHPFCTDRNKHGAKWWKNQANRKIRRSFEIPDGNQYRKFYDSWQIRDWIWYESKARAIVWYNRVTSEGYAYDYYKELVLKKWPTLESYLNNCWAHDFYRK